jgi:hypothetical protein
VSAGWSMRFYPHRISDAKSNEVSGFEFIDNRIHLGRGLLKVGQMNGPVLDTLSTDISLIPALSGHPTKFAGENTNFCNSQPN